ncbi:MAG TPA: hypothetical protein VG860_00980 [Terriglobia bacterium]|nr:hypothetical protein [Terriglobia bacterium]
MTFVDANTTLFMISDHGIKPLREFGDEHETHNHGSSVPSTTPVIAKHDFPDGDDVPGAFIAMGPRIQNNYENVGIRGQRL